MTGPRGPGSAGQTYLVGQHLYLRPPVAGDAAHVMAWRDDLWPVSPKRAEEWLEKKLPKEFEQRRWRLIACRLADDAPIGSVWIDEKDDAPSAWVRLFASAALSAAERELALSGMLALIIEWLGMERGAPAIEADFAACDAGVIAAGEALGMRRSYRLRQGFWRDGALHDWITLQWMHPAWIARMGDPGPGIDLEGEPVAEPRSPAPLRWPERSLPLPRNTVIASTRLALRPFEPDDHEPVARSFMEEAAASFGHPRMPISPLTLARWHAEADESEPPSEVEFAIVLRETGEVIGDNGIYYIDWLSRTAETGSWIYRAQHRGGGLGTEAKHLLLEWAFQRAGINMVWSWVYLDNDRSAAALRKQGYREAGRIDWIGRSRDGFTSARVFDLLATEWRAARRPADG
ncbi:MAG: GNAT family N-acetyltransferase [Chloroflexota bacterium]